MSAAARRPKLMNDEFLTLAVHLVVALCAGGLIGLERSFHGRPAGFRTHSLVCLASSALMLLAHYPPTQMPGLPLDAIRTDPLRMAQGIMTGIGFLGAGVIFKQGLGVRGLTTAASIWVTSAIGILAGSGHYLATAIVTTLTLGVLTAFRWLEIRLPAHLYAQHNLRCLRADAMREDEVRTMLTKLGFTITTMSYRVSDDGEFLEYRMVIRTDRAADLSRLADTLLHTRQVHSFQLSPTGD